MITRKVLYNVGLYEDTYSGYVEDYALYFKLLEYGIIAKLDKPLYYYNVSLYNKKAYEQHVYAYYAKNINSQPYINKNNFIYKWNRFWWIFTDYFKKKSNLSNFVILQYIYKMISYFFYPKRIVNSLKSIKNKVIK